MDHDELNRLHAEADRRWRRRMVLVVVLIVVVIPVAVIIPFLFGSTGSRRSVPWGLLAAVTGATIALMLITIAVVLLVQRRRTGRWGPAPLAVTGTRSSVRRVVFRAVRRGELPTSQPERILAGELARRTVAQRWAPWLNAGLALLMAANAVLQITEGQRFTGVTALCTAAVFALVAVLALQQRRGARRLLDALGSPRHEH